MGETPKKTLGLETSEPAVTPPPTDVEKAIEKNLLIQGQPGNVKFHKAYGRSAPVAAK